MHVLAQVANLRGLPPRAVLLVEDFQPCHLESTPGHEGAEDLLSRTTSRTGHSSKRKKPLVTKGFPS
jgi:hypothetical protein